MPAAPLMPQDLDSYNRIMLSQHEILGSSGKWGLNLLAPFLTGVLTSKIELNDFHDMMNLTATSASVVRAVHANHVVQMLLVARKDVLPQSLLQNFLNLTRLGTCVGKRASLLGNHNICIQLCYLQTS